MYRSHFDYGAGILGIVCTFLQARGTLELVLGRYEAAGEFGSYFCDWWFFWWCFIFHSLTQCYLWDRIDFCACFIWGTGSYGWVFVQLGVGFGWWFSRGRRRGWRCWDCIFFVRVQDFGFVRGRIRWCLSRMLPRKSVRWAACRRHCVTGRWTGCCRGFCWGFCFEDSAWCVFLQPHLGRHTFSFFVWANQC